MTFRDYIKAGDQLLNNFQLGAAFDKYYQAYEEAMRLQDPTSEIEAEESMRLCMLQSLEEEGFNYFYNCTFKKAHDIFTEAIKIIETSKFTTVELTDYVAELTHELRAHRKVAQRYLGSEMRSQEAIQLLKQGKFRQAKRICKSIRQQFPDHPIDQVLDKVYETSDSYRQNLKTGIDLYNAGQFEQAQVHLEKAYQIKPTDKVLDLIQSCKATNFYSSLLEIDRTGKLPKIKHIYMPTFQISDVQKLFGTRIEDILAINQDLFKTVSILEDLEQQIFREFNAPTTETTPNENVSTSDEPHLGKVIEKQTFATIFKEIAEKEVKIAFKTAFKEKMDEVFDLKATREEAIETTLNYMVQQAMGELGTKWSEAFFEKIKEIKEKLDEENKNKTQEKNIENSIEEEDNEDIEAENLPDLENETLTI